MIAIWLKVNKLSLNVKKSVYLLFSGRKPLPHHLPTLTIFNKPICSASETKFLGLFIDNKLNWKSHAAYVHTKISRMMGILFKIKNILTSAALKTLYQSLIYPHLQYGIIFWGAVNKSNFEKIFRVQKKCVRLISHASRFSHTEPLFKLNKILRLEDVKRLEMCKFIFNDLNFGHRFNFFTRNATHNYNTRFSSTLDLPRPRINSFKASVFYSGLKFFNDLPAHLKQAVSKSSFKINFKLLILDTYCSI